MIMNETSCLLQLLVSMKSDHLWSKIIFLLTHFTLHARMNLRPNQVRIVPMGTPITALVDRQRIVDNNARRLEVLRNCINFVFDNKISDARIVSPASLQGCHYSFWPLNNNLWNCQWKERNLKPRKIVFFFVKLISY